MEIGGSATLNNATITRPIEREQEPVQTPAVDRTADREALNNEQNRANETQQARGPEVQAQLETSRQQESERRRSEEPADQLRNQIDNIVGGGSDFEAQIDELV